MYHDQSDTTTVYSIDDLRRIILPLVVRRGMNFPRLFGSYARGSADGLSDIDLLVDVGDKPVTSVAALGFEISEATGKSADVYDVSELVDGPFRTSILREAVAL